MKLSLVILALFGCAVHGFFFGCDMHAAAGVSTGGYGQVACYSAVIDSDTGEVNLACAFKYANLTSAPTLAHLHVGDITVVSGPPTITFSGSGWTSAVAGTAYNQFTSSSGFTQQNGLAFPAQVSQCASGGCYFNLHTGNNGGGELRCQMGPLSTSFSASGLTLTPSPGAVNTTGSFLGVPLTSTGRADAAMAQVGTSGVYAWGYYVQYVTFSPVNNAHIHQGTSATDNAGAVKVKLDQGTNFGYFLGVALEGITNIEQPNSYWPVHDASFDTALAQGFCYINVHTNANPITGEIRANLVNGASQATLALFAIVAMIASFLSL